MLSAGVNEDGSESKHFQVSAQAYTVRTDTLFSYVFGLIIHFLCSGHSFYDPFGVIYSSEHSYHHPTHTNISQIMTGQKHAIECMVHLMSTGYVNPPMTFLTTHLAGLDGVYIYLCLCIYVEANLFMSTLI
jgi:hypothetical protein